MPPHLSHVPAMGFLLPRLILRPTYATKISALLPAEARQQHQRAIASAVVPQPQSHPPPHHDLPPYEPYPRPSSSYTLTTPRPRPSKLPPDTKPFSSFLTDTFHRQHTYLRISITERCNLRCTYCMPANGIPLSPSADLLTTPEIVYLSQLFVEQGVTKIRLTGGEPTIRKDIVALMQQIGSLRNQGLKELCLTTNGITLHRKLDSLAAAGLTGVNLSLDTLDPLQFQIMTRRTGFEAVMRSISRILEMNKAGAGIKLKINCVVMRGINEGEICRFVEFGREKDVEVRFIEYMPFEGNRWERGKMLGFKEMVEVIRQKYPELEKVPEAGGGGSETSKTYQVRGFRGRVGFITSMTENFCGGCNRLRITSDGNLKVCLFGNAEVSLRDLLRKGNGLLPADEEEGALEGVKRVEMDGRQGLVGSGEGGVVGYAERERELLEVIGMAVKRKKARHAGMGELENMKNRPMILIDGNLPGRTHSQIMKAMVGTTRQTHLHFPSRGLFPRSRSTPIAYYLLHSSSSGSQLRAFSTSINHGKSANPTPPPTPLLHLTPTSTIHQTSITSKPSTHRVAIAIGHIRFSTPRTLPAIRAHLLKKGDVLAVARVGAISAMKETGRLVVLCHGGVGVEGAEVEVEAVDAVDRTRRQEDVVDALDVGAERESRYVGSEEERIRHAMRITEPIGECGGIRLAMQVETTAKTGIEMEALAGIMGAALNVVDMVKGVDKGVVIEEVKVVGKKGGRSGGWGVWGAERAHVKEEEGEEEEEEEGGR